MASGSPSPAQRGNLELSCSGECAARVEFRPRVARSLAIPQFSLEGNRRTGSMATMESRSGKLRDSSAKAHQYRSFTIPSFANYWRGAAELAQLTESRVNQFSGLHRRRSESSNEPPVKKGRSIENIPFSAGWSRATFGTSFSANRSRRSAPCAVAACRLGYS
jgi:hypothetical protein